MPMHSGSDSPVVCLSLKLIASPTSEALIARRLSEGGTCKENRYQATKLKIYLIDKYKV